MKRGNGFAPAGTVLGRTSSGRVVRVSEPERARHMHVIGSPGTGKSKLLEYLIRQDILAGRGLCLLDPHGYLYDDLVAWCASRKLLGRRRIYLLDASSSEWSFGFNPLRLGSFAPETIAHAVDSMIKACAQVWGGEDTARTPLLRRCLRSVFHVLAEHGLTLAETIPLMSAEDSSGLRRYLTREIRHPLFAAQWNDFNAMRTREFQDAFASTNNRLVEFLHSPIVERIVGQDECVLDLRGAMDEGAIILVKLGGSALSLDAGRLLGALLLSDLFLRAIARPAGSRPFRVYVDECHRFLNDDVARILNEGRKFGLHLVLAHQNLGQLREAGESVFRAVFGMAKQKVVFGGLDPEDAELFARSVFVGEFDYEAVKPRFNKPTVVGYDRARMANRSTGQSWSETSGVAQTRSEGETYDSEGGESLSYHTQESSGESSSSSHGETTTEGWSESLVPILEERPSQGYSLDELRDRAAARLMQLPDQTALVKLRNTQSAEVQVPTIRSANVNKDRIAAFAHVVMSRTDCVLPVAAADRKLRDRRRALLEAARAYADPDEPTRFRG